MATIHIIGAGISGLSAAAALATHPHRICLYEATGQAGGRCRSFADGQLGHLIDNGNHLLIQSNHQALALLDRIGARQHWQSQADGYHFYDIDTNRHRHFRPSWRRALPRNIREAFCHAALNTPLDAVSKRFLLKVAWQMLWRKGWIAQVPIVPLQAAIIDPLIRYLQHYHHSLYYHHALKAWNAGAEGNVCELNFTQGSIPLAAQDVVILAIPPWETQRLLPEMDVPLHYEPIINCHFRMDADALNALSDTSKNDKKLTGVLGGLAEWIFVKDGIISTTTSAASRHKNLGNEAIAAQLWREVCAALNLSLPLPAHRIVTEKRATFACTTENLKRRPLSTTLHPNLFLAGDYLATGLPACIEGAVQSGQKAASHALKWIAKATI